MGKTTKGNQGSTPWTGDSWTAPKQTTIDDVIAKYKAGIPLTKKDAAIRDAYANQQGDRTGGGGTFGPAGRSIKNALFPKAPDAKRWGGSEEAYNEAQGRYQTGTDVGNEYRDAGIQTSNDAYAALQRQNAALQGQYASQGGAYGTLADRYGADRASAMSAYGTDRSNYAAGRAGILGNASALEASANAMPGAYQQTSALTLDRNMGLASRNALSTAQGSGGGALAIRNALAAQGASNADAVSQAGITQANENNQILQMQAAQRAQAAAIRSGVSGQDQANAGQAAGQAQFAGQAQLLARNAQTGVIGQQADMARGQATVGLNAGNQSTNAGLTSQGNYLDARSQMEAAQLGVPQQQKNRLGAQILSGIADPANLRGAPGGQSFLS